jgi:hypothetical protein
MLDNVKDFVEDHLVRPTGGEFGLAGLSGPVPVPAAKIIAVEDVRSAFGRDADGVQRRLVLGVYRIPPGTLRSLGMWATALIRGNGRVVRRAGGIVLGPAPPLGRLAPLSSRVRTRSTVTGFLGPDQVLVVTSPV